MSDINHEDFMNLYRKCTTKQYSFLGIDTTFTSDNLLRFRENLLKRKANLIVATDNNIRHEKLQYNIKRGAAKISALSSVKINKYEYLTGEEMLPSDQRQMMKQAKFTYSSLGKALEKQVKKLRTQLKNKQKQSKVESQSKS